MMRMNESVRSGLLRRSALGLLVVAVLWPSPAGASERLRPVNEGGDYAPCVTAAEFDVANFPPKHRVQRIFDTNGVKVDSHRIDLYVAGFDRAPKAHRQVRSYPVCPRPADGVIGGEVLIEFDMSGRRDPMMAGHYDEWTDWAG